MVVYQPPAHPFGELWNTHRIAMSFILDELVIKLSEDFAVFKFGYPMTHELGEVTRIFVPLEKNSAAPHSSVSMWEVSWHTTL